MGRMRGMSSSSSVFEDTAATKNDNEHCIVLLRTIAYHFRWVDSWMLMGERGTGIEL